VTPESDPRLLRFLQDLVRTESTPGREKLVVERVVRELQTLGYDEAWIDPAGNAVGRIGSGRPVVLIDCHIDTIPLHSLGDWRHDPFEAKVEDGRLFGLGSCDMKGSAAAMVYGVASLVEQRGLSRGTVYVVGSIAEEMMEGMALASTFDACSPDIAIIGEPTDLAVAIGQRGRAKIEAVVTGRACHAGHPSVGINAAEHMAEFIRAIAGLTHPTHPQMGSRSITCIDVHSEPYPSVSMVPSRCIARFDCRFGPEDTAASLLDLLQAKERIWRALENGPSLDCHLYEATFETWTGGRHQVPEWAPAWSTDPESTLVRQCRAALDAAGLPSATTVYQFCTNGSLTAGLRGVPTVGYGVGREADAHTVDESIAVQDLYRCARGYAAIVSGLLEGSVV
jgi:putative selenium metabolism hydrolase